MAPLAHYFFDLKDFAHKSLFSDEKPVWQALKNLKSYFDAFNLGRVCCRIPTGVTLIRPDQIFIGEKTRVEPGVCIQGPCIIGNQCEIRHGAYIRPYSIIGDQCTVGHVVEVKHSILLNNASAAHFNYVGDSILGNRVNLGAGVVCANLRLDRKEVSVCVGHEKIKTGLRKLGTIIGDDSQIGCNTVINPGILLKKKTLSRACVCWQVSNWSEGEKIDHAKNRARAKTFNAPSEAI